MTSRGQKRNLVRGSRVCAALGVGLALGWLGGCASGNDPAAWQGPANSGGGEYGVFRTAEVRAYDSSSLAMVDQARFEFSRRDADLNPVRYGPLVAANQWPQAPKPAERRIRFWIWEQR